MRKAVRLRVTLYVRGEDEPAHDFARAAKRAVREIIAAGRGAHPELKVSVRRVAEEEEEEDDENDAAPGEAGAEIDADGERPGRTATGGDG